MNCSLDVVDVVYCGGEVYQVRVPHGPGRGRVTKNLLQLNFFSRFYFFPLFGFQYKKNIFCSYLHLKLWMLLKEMNQFLRYDKIKCFDTLHYIILNIIKWKKCIKSAQGLHFSVRGCILNVKFIFLPPPPSYFCPKGYLLQ